MAFRDKLEIVAPFFIIKLFCLSEFLTSMVVYICRLDSRREDGEESGSKTETTPSGDDGDGIGTR